MCLYILRCNRCCVSLQLCQLLCYQLPFLQNDVMAELLKLSLRCSADASFPASPSVSWSNVGLHPEQQGCSPYVLLQKTEPRHVTCSFTHQPKIYMKCFCSHIKRHGQRMAHHHDACGKPQIPLTFIMFTEKTCLPLGERDIFLMSLKRRRK